MPDQQSDTILVGISGPSSSGKTTLARLLRDIWPNSFILHEDDFYWPDQQIPVKEGVQDWDCRESLDLKRMLETLHFIKQNGRLPPDFESKEDQNSVGECDVDPTTTATLQGRAAELLSTRQPTRIAIVDGFLLYSEEMETIWKMLDVRLFLRTDYATLKKRRENRSGYVTLEGFWEDPPGYVDKIVWPNYVKDHAFLFQAGNVEAQYDATVCKAMSLEAIPSNAQLDMNECLLWAFEKLRVAVQSYHVMHE